MTAPAGTGALVAERVLEFSSQTWRTDVMDHLADYVRVPAKSPIFDPEWEARGLLDAVCDSVAQWLRNSGIPHVEVLREGGRTPAVFFDAPGRGATADRTVLFYGHLDKQPEFEGWSAESGPWEPRYDGTRLYGRGAADDGYAAFAAATAIRAVDAQEADRPRCVGLFETGEESGSPDLGYWLDHLAPRLGEVHLVLCLDSGAGDYDRLWVVNSLRGHCGGRLEVRVLDEGAHAGDAGGVVPSSFRISRQIMERIEDSATGEILLESARATIPPHRITQARAAALAIGDGIFDRFAWPRGESGARRATSRDPAQALLNRSWRPSLEVTGADGLPPTAAAGNVLRPTTALQLSLRLPPGVDSRRALEDLSATLTRDPPYGADVTFTPSPVTVDGWDAADYPQVLTDALNSASVACFGGNGLAYLGQGGTIPLMALLTRAFPGAFLVAGGVQGPGTNAHGPNEALHVPYAIRLTAAIALVLHRM